MKRPPSLNLSASDTLEGEAPSRLPKRSAALAASAERDENDWVATLHQSKTGHDLPNATRNTSGLQYPRHAADSTWLTYTTKAPTTSAHLSNPALTCHF